MIKGYFKESPTDICLMINYHGRYVSVGRWDKVGNKGEVTHFHGGVSKQYKTKAGWKKGLKTYGYTWEN